MSEETSEQAVAPREVEHVADLARVALDEAEAERFAAQFGDVLDYFDALDSVPEVEREPDLVNVLRTDEVRESLSQEAALENAPETEDGYVRGPPVS